MFHVKLGERGRDSTFDAHSQGRAAPSNKGRRPQTVRLGRQLHGSQTRTRMWPSRFCVSAQQNPARKLSHKRWSTPQGSWGMTF